MKKVVVLFSGLIIFAVVLSLLAMPRPALAQFDPNFRQVVQVDIKPGSCPSSINLRKKKGVTPVAIVGTPDFDVAMVDLTSVELEGVSAIAYEILDSTEPYDPNIHSMSDDIHPGLDECYDCFAAEDNLNCDTDGDGIIDAYCGDGILDLILYFSTVELSEAIEEDGCVLLTLTGQTFEGLMIDGNDIARIK